MEIACDESGYEGEKLIGTTTDVFAHASVRLDAEQAEECIQELRKRIRSPATHYKANHILREKHRKVLLWFLGESSPAYGHAHVFLIEKEFYLLGKVVSLLLPNAPHRTEILYREGHGTLGHDAWHAFLVSCNDFMRTRKPVPEFLDLAQELSRVGAPSAVSETLNLLSQATPPSQIAPIDPLIPAIVAAVAYWGPVSIAHDRQNMLRTDRVTLLKEMLDGELTSFRLVNSFTDFRVQVADVLAGAVRKIATDELHGRPDVELTILLRPYLDESSIMSQ